MSTARDDYPYWPAPSDRRFSAEGSWHWSRAMDEIDRLRAELTVANNRLGNAVGALIDAGTYCTGVDDVTAGIDRLRAENEVLRNGDEAWRVVLPKIAAERASWEAIRQRVNCPTCGGSRLLPGKCDGSLDTYGECLGFHPCLDCTDGHPPMARLLRIAVLTLTVDPDRHTFPTQQALLDYLRSVTP